MYDKIKVVNTGQMPTLHKQNNNNNNNLNSLMVS